MSKQSAGARHKKRLRPRRLGTETEAAGLLGVTPDALRNARCTGRGDLARIEWFKLGNARGAPVRYDLNWIEDVYLESCRRVHGEPEPDEAAA